MKGRRKIKKESKLEERIARMDRQKVKKKKKKKRKARREENCKMKRKMGKGELERF